MFGRKGLHFLLSKQGGITEEDTTPVSQGLVSLETGQFKIMPRDNCIVIADTYEKQHRKMQKLNNKAAIHLQQP